MKKYFKRTYCYTGKSFSEVFIITTTNSQYDKSLFIESPVSNMKNSTSEHV